MIRGFFDIRFQPPIPRVVAGLVLPHRGASFTPVEFVLDTGASASCLHPRDAIERLGFTEDELASLRGAARAEQSFAGITGAGVYFVVLASYLLAHDDGRLDVIDGEVRIAQPAPGNATIPSVLGWDILGQFRIVLDRRTGEVLLQ